MPISGFILILIIFIFSPGISYAHPGRTASDGCHYCRTNCDKWGVPWNERHCHGGGYATPYTTPYSTPYTTPFTPSPKPTIRSTPSPTPTSTPTPTPEVKGETTIQTPTPSPAVEGTQTQETSTSDTLWGLGILAAIGGGAFWLVRSLWRKFRGQPPQPNG